LFIMSSEGVAVAYPWSDVVSSIPPDFQYHKIFWYYLGDKKHNPEKKLVSTGEPFAEILGNGFIKVYIAPIYDNEQFKGVCNSDVYVTPLARETLRKYKTPLLFVSAETTVLGANEKAIGILGVKMLREFEYVKQLQKNEFASDEYKLNYDSNAPWLKSIGAGIKSGNTKFEIKVKGTAYHVTVKALPHQDDLYVIALLQE